MRCVKLSKGGRENEGLNQREGGVMETVGGKNEWEERREERGEIGRVQAAEEWERVSG